jgi:hypothetical protein
MSNGKANVDICSDIVTVRSRENQGLMTETDNLLVLVTCHMSPRHTRGNADTCEGEIRPRIRIYA